MTRLTDVLGEEGFDPERYASTSGTITLSLAEAMEVLTSMSHSLKDVQPDFLPAHEAVMARIEHFAYHLFMRAKYPEVTDDDFAANCPLCLAEAALDSRKDH